MKYSVLPVEACDVSELNTLYLDVFEDNGIRVNLWPNVSLEAKLAHKLRRYFTLSTLDGSRFVKAMDLESGCVSSRWAFFSFLHMPSLIIWPYLDIPNEVRFCFIC